MTLDTENTETEQPETPDAAPEPQEQEQQSNEAAANEAEPQDGAEPEAAPEDGEEEQQPKEAATAGEKPKPRAGGWQRRIAHLQSERDMLRAQLAAAANPAPAQPAKEKTPEEKAAEYIDGLVAKRLEAERAAEKQARVQAEFVRRTAEVRAAHPDYDEVVLSADAPVSHALGQALLTSEHGPSIMYELAKSPAELARLSALPPLDAAREVGRLEARLASSTAAPPRPKPATRPPAPPTSVGGTASSTRSLEDLPISEYKRAYRSGRR